MSNLSIRENVKGYVRDTYLGLSDIEYNKEYSIIDCLIGSSQWGVSQKAVETHTKQDIQVQAVYPEPFYDQLLKPAILRRFGVVGLESGNIFFGHGSFNLAERLIHKLISPGVMLGVGPQFNEIPSEFVAAGGTYQTVLIKNPDYAFPKEMLKNSLREGISVMYIDNPNNPLGRLIDIQDLSELVAVANQENVIVIVDEAYADFVDDKQSAAHLVPHFQNVAVLRSFSKGLGLAAARIGYMFLSSAIAKYYQPLDVPFEPTLSSAELARATLDDLAFIFHVRNSTAESKSLLMPFLEEIGFTILPTHPATSIMTLFREGHDVVKMFASIGVSVEPGSAFRKTHSGWDNSYCRFRLPKKDDLQELQSRLKHIQHIRKEIPC